MAGRDIAVISNIVLGTTEVSGPPAEFALFGKNLERIAGKYGGRPHWGKMHWSDAPTLRAAYGDDAWAAFAEQREAMDPTGVFLNDYLRAHLGL